MSGPSQHTDLHCAIRVLLASDVRLYRDGLMWGLASSGRIQIVAVSDTAAQALAQVHSDSPEVLLVDMTMASAMDLVRAVAISDSPTKVIVFAVAGGDQAILACIEAGAVGYVPREGSMDELVQTVESVARGEARCSPLVAASLFRRVARLASSPIPLPVSSALTQRESQIVGLIEQGLSNREIALQLGIEVATTKNHVHNILEKLQLRRRSQVAARLSARVVGLAARAPGWGQRSRSSL